ncbi:MAG: hypothetical protein ACP5DC_09530 [Halothiobacillaceae bacterium]
MQSRNDVFADFWAVVHRACRLEEIGIPLSEFLGAPELILSGLGMDDAVEQLARGYLPLVPAQAAARREWQDAEPAPGPAKDHAQAVLPSAA